MNIETCELMKVSMRTTFSVGSKHKRKGNFDDYVAIMIPTLLREHTQITTANQRIGVDNSLPKLPVEKFAVSED